MTRKEELVELRVTATEKANDLMDYQKQKNGSRDC